MCAVPGDCPEWLEKKFCPGTDSDVTGHSHNCQKGNNVTGKKQKFLGAFFFLARERNSSLATLLLA
jgi:hypothetical protein